MGNMTYCRHENTAQDLADVWDRWEDYTPGDRHEDRGRAQLIQLVREMHEQFQFDGTYDEMADADA